MLLTDIIGVAPRQRLLQIGELGHESIIKDVPDLPAMGQLTVANEIYKQAHLSLSGIVSSRAATRALDTALQKSGFTPDSVTVDGMRSVLMGPVLNEFKQILPLAGLKRTLQNVVDDLQTLHKVEQASSNERNESLNVDTSMPDISVLDTSERKKLKSSSTVLFEDDDDVVSNPGPVAADTPATPQPASVTSTPPADTPVPAEPIAEATTSAPASASATSEVTSSAVTPPPEPPTSSGAVAVATPQASPAKTPDVALKSYSQEELESALRHFASIDYVKLVAAIGEKGQVIASLGSGYDLDALSRLGVTGLKLLKRNGLLRSYYLAHNRGQFFLFPYGAQTLVVIGSPELNLGTVFTALTALKEEL